MGRLFLLLACLPLSALAAADGGVAPPLSVTARALTDKVKLGEPFDVQVVITHLSDQRLDLDVPDEQGAFDLVTQTRKRVDGPASSTTTFTVSFSGFELGKQKTPALTFQIASPDGQGQVTQPGLDVEIVGTLPPEAEKSGAGLFDVRPPEDVPIRTWRLLYALAIGAAVAGLAWFVLKQLRQRASRPAISLAPSLPLHLRTRNALDALRKEDLPASGRAREFYFRLSEIVRQYLGERYAFDAMEKTTPELVATLRTLHTPGLPLHQLTTFANDSDFVRYARATPTPETCKEAIELAYRIVDATNVTATPVAAAVAPKPPGPSA